MKKISPEEQIYQLEASANDVTALARSGDKYALRKLARVTVQLAQCMDELMNGDAPAHKEAVECWQPIFEEMPFLPVLKYRHDGDLKTHRQRLDLLNVGSKFNYAKEGAKFDPYTPINQYVGSCLVHLQKVRTYIDERLQSGQDKTPEKALARCIKHKRDTGWLYADEIPIHLAAYKLPPLAKSGAATGQKSLAEKWAHEVIVPLILLRESPLENFAVQMGWSVRREQLQSDIQRFVAQSLETLAPASSNKPAS